MLNLERSTDEQKKTAENAAKNSKLLSELLDGLRWKKCPDRYKNFKAVHIISEDNPQVLYEKWDLFEKMLTSSNNTYKFYAIHILANLARVDQKGKFEKIVNDFYRILNGDALIPACHVAYVSGKIASAKPELADEITKRLLHIERAACKHKELVQANALKAFSEFLNKINDKDRVINLARTLQADKSPRARKQAKEFLKRLNSLTHEQVT